MKIYNYKTLKELIDNLVQIVDLDEQLLQSKLERSWVEIIGPAAANSVTVTFYKNKVLYLKTHSSTWRTELLLRKREIIDRINQKFENEIIKDINIH